MAYKSFLAITQQPIADLSEIFRGQAVLNIISVMWEMPAFHRTWMFS